MIWPTLQHSSIYIRNSFLLTAYYDNNMLNETRVALIN